MGTRVGRDTREHHMIYADKVGHLFRAFCHQFITCLKDPYWIIVLPKFCYADKQRVTHGNSPHPSLSKMNTNSPTDYKALFLQEQERRRQAEEEGRQEKERNRNTTLVEFLRCCHKVLSRPLRVRTSSDSTTGEIPIPKGKHWSTLLERWVDCPTQQQGILQLRTSLPPGRKNAPRLFLPRIMLDALSERFKGPMGGDTT